MPYDWVPGDQVTVPTRSVDIYALCLSLEQRPPPDRPGHHVVDSHLSPLSSPVVRDYLADGALFPERLHLIARFADFSGRFIDLLDAWGYQVLAEVDPWPSTKDVGLTPFGRKTS